VIVLTYIFKTFSVSYFKNLFFCFCLNVLFSLCVYSIFVYLFMGSELTLLRDTFKKVVTR
jgi:hypothetical protein